MAMIDSNLPSEKEIEAIIKQLRSREGDFTTPKSQIAYMNKLNKYQEMLVAVRTGQANNGAGNAMRGELMSA